MVCVGFGRRYLLLLFAVAIKNEGESKGGENGQKGKVEKGGYEGLRLGHNSQGLRRQGQRSKGKQEGEGGRYVLGLAASYYFAVTFTFCRCNKK